MGAHADYTFFAHAEQSHLKFAVHIPSEGSSNERQSFSDFARSAGASVRGRG
jgi:hypothetical protein